MERESSQILKEPKLTSQDPTIAFGKIFTYPVYPCNSYHVEPRFKNSVDQDQLASEAR